MQTVSNSDSDRVKSLREELIAAHHNHSDILDLWGSGKVTSDDVEKAKDRLDKALEENAAYWSNL